MSKYYLYYLRWKKKYLCLVSINQQVLQVTLDLPISFVTLKDIFKKFNVYLFLREREREREHEWVEGEREGQRERERERENESEAGSRL